MLKSSFFTAQDIHFSSRMRILQFMFKKLVNSVKKEYFNRLILIAFIRLIINYLHNFVL
jgi:hypothetical protein